MSNSHWEELTLCIHVEEKKKKNASLFSSSQKATDEVCVTYFS